MALVSLAADPFLPFFVDSAGVLVEREETITVNLAGGKFNPHLW